MDPLTHSLAGACLAETPLARRWGSAGGLSRGLTTGLLLLAANAPDVDVACWAVGPDFALGHRRGWTHGLLAMVALPLLVTGLVLLWRRWRGPGTGGASRRPVLLLAAVGVWSHPLLDLLNVYGIRLLAPLDWSWFYGDAVHIVDPWLWLILGGAVFLVRSRSRRGALLWGTLGGLTTAAILIAAPPAARWVWLAWVAVLAALRLRGAVSEPSGGRLAWAALGAAVLYCTAMAASAVAGAALVREQIAARGEGPLRGLMVGPEPADPFHRRVVVEIPVGYLLGRVSWLEEPRLELDPRIIPYPAPSPEVRAALQASSVQGFLEWVRFPTTEVEAGPDGAAVHFVDLRYARRPTGEFGTATVRLDEQLQPVER